MRQFVADASHELRTPLTTIRGFAELYRQGAVAEPEDVAKLVRRIEDEAARMGLLVEDLLLLARLDRERPITLAPVELPVLAVDAVQAAQAIAPERDDRAGRAGRSGEAGRVRRRRPAAAGDRQPDDQRAGAHAAGRLGDPAAVRRAGQPRGGGGRGHRAGAVAGAARNTSSSGSTGPTGRGPGVPTGRPPARASAWPSWPRSCAAHHGKVEVVSEPGEGATFRVTLPALAGGKTPMRPDDAAFTENIQGQHRVVESASGQGWSHERARDQPAAARGSCRWSRRTGPRKPPSTAAARSGDSPSRRQRSRRSSSPAVAPQSAPPPAAAPVVRARSPPRPQSGAAWSASPLAAAAGAVRPAVPDELRASAAAVRRSAARRTALTRASRVSTRPAGSAPRPAGSAAAAARPSRCRPAGRHRPAGQLRSRPEGLRGRCRRDPDRAGRRWRRCRDRARHGRRQRHRHRADRQLLGHAGGGPLLAGPDRRRGAGQRRVDHDRDR